MAKLGKNGIAVSVGLLEKEARVLNEAFFTFHEKKRPFIAIKFAASLDGKTATKTHDSKWITNEKARMYARKLRSEYQAILVGINTVLLDNPHLGIRMKGKQDPVRIILDSTLKIPLESHVLRDANIFIATTRKADKEKKKKLLKNGIPILSFGSDMILLKDLLRELYTRGIVSVLVEGGSETLGSFIDERLVDRVYAFYAPLIIGGKKGLPAVGGVGSKSVAGAIHVSPQKQRCFGDNFLIYGKVTSKK